MFPWPPPQASSKEVIPKELLLVEPHLFPRTLGEINDHIVRALWRIGHTEYSYFIVPYGYALVTRLEKINSDGSPKSGAERWEIKLGSSQDFSLKNILQSLFTAKAGYYRIIVFIVSPKPLIEGIDKVSEDEAISWLRRGADRLPGEIAMIPFSENYACTALIYEFEQKSPKTRAHLLSPGKIPAHIHLEVSGFYKALGG